MSHERDIEPDWRARALRAEEALAANPNARVFCDDAHRHTAKCTVCSVCGGAHDGACPPKRKFRCPGEEFDLCDGRHLEENPHPGAVEPEMLERASRWLRIMFGTTRWTEGLSRSLAELLQSAVDAERERCIVASCQWCKAGNPRLRDEEGAVFHAFPGEAMDGECGGRFIILQSERDAISKLKEAK